MKLLSIEPNAATATIHINTGEALPNGQPLRTAAKIYCQDAFTASLVARHLQERLGDAVEQARRRAYWYGYRDAQKSLPPAQHFSRQL